MNAGALCTDQEAIAAGFIGSECQRRREVLRETIAAFENAPTPDHFHRRALSNLAAWAAEAKPNAEHPLRLLVISGDWGEVTLSLSKSFGACFAVLNMANAYFPGGAYAQGAVAQEENMFRRTDCHFRILPDHLDKSGRMYSTDMTALVSGAGGRVYLDASSPRVCISDPASDSRTSDCW